tara:strand:- start:210 stop:824 length:615 start_codon:yes stop_codon:yes gene_type:complete
MSNPKQSTQWYVSAIEVTTDNGREIFGNRKDIFTTDEDGNLTHKKLHSRMLECLGEISPNTEKLMFEFYKDIMDNESQYIENHKMWCYYDPSDGYIGDFEGDLKQVLNGATSPINKVCQRLNERVFKGAFTEDDNGEVIFSYGFSDSDKLEDLRDYTDVSNLSFWIVHSRGEKKIFSWDMSYLYTQCGFQFKRSEIHYFRVVEN